MGLSPENSAFIRQLQEQSADALYRVARRYAQRLNGITADDIVQETYLKACEHIKKVRTYRCPEAWLMKTAYNIFRSAHKRELRELSLQENYDVPDERPYDRGIGDCLPASTSEQDRDILTRYYEWGDDAAQIATDLHIKQDTTRQRLKRARDRLREKFKWM